jgi:hypothetical protein
LARTAFGHPWKTAPSQDVNGMSSSAVVATVVMLRSDQGRVTMEANTMDGWQFRMLLV